MVSSLLEELDLMYYLGFPGPMCLCVWMGGCVKGRDEKIVITRIRLQT